MATATHLSSLAADLAEMGKLVRMNKRHQYDILIDKEWVRVPSVTNINGHAGKGDALIGWAAKCQSEADIDVAWDLITSTDPVALTKADVATYMRGRAHEWRRQRDKAADLGTQIHSLIEQECRRMIGQAVETVAVSDEARFVFHEWADWAKSSDLKPIAMEQQVYSVKHMYAGTFDLLAYVNGVLTIVDWKSKNGKGCYPEHRLQSIAYRRAMAEMGCPEPAGLILRLPKTGEDLNIEPIPLEDDPDKLHAAFVNLRQFAAWHSDVA